MNVNVYFIEDYENETAFRPKKTKPKQTQYPQRVKLMQSLYLQRITKKNAAKGYEKTKPKQTQYPQRVKLMQSVYLQRIMKINVDMGSKKTNPNKPCPERSRMGQFSPNFKNFISQFY